MVVVQQSVPERNLGLVTALVEGFYSIRLIPAVVRWRHHFSKPADSEWRRGQHAPVGPAPALITQAQPLVSHLMEQLHLV